MPLSIVEQAAILGALNPEILSDQEQAGAAAEYIARRLDALEQPSERGWNGEALTDGGLSFTRVLRGVPEGPHVIDGDVIRSAESRAIDQQAAEMQRVYSRHGKLVAKDEDEFTVTGPVSLVEHVMALGRKGVSMQRYKGLGEMNAEELRETTLDPDNRTLIQVKMTNAADADDMFRILMGDKVEPRREFIEKHALEVKNLDV